MTGLRWLSGILVTAALAACTASLPSPTGEPWPNDPAAQMRPDEMVIDPNETSPGALVAVAYVTGWDRGVLYAIDAQGRAGWERRFMLISDANGAEPTWFRNGDAGVAVEMVGIVGQGPDHVRIPDVMAPGTYRLCTANARANVCAFLDIGSP
jgi:hypothetical protein